MLAGALVGAEFIARAVVGGIAADEIARALPPEVRAEVVAAPTGGCVVCELLGGGLSGLDVRGDSVAVGGLTGSVDAHASGVRLGDPVRIDALEGTVGVGADELSALVVAAANEQGVPLREVRFGDGEIDYRAEIDLFGLEFGADITSRLELRSGGRLQVQATAIQVDAGDVGGGFQLDPANFSLQFCLAEHLPANLEITSVRVYPDGLEAGVRTTGAFTTTEDAFAQLGSCG